MSSEKPSGGAVRGGAAGRGFIIRAAILVCLSFAVLGAGLVGFLRPLDNTLRDFRFSLETRPATGAVVFVDIDSESLKKIGVWPWPRHYHAELLDRLMAMGAETVAFDIDFSAASSEAEDSRLEQSLADAGGYALLAAFRQSDAGVDRFNFPLPRFRAHADAVAVNVDVDNGGAVRAYPFAIAMGTDLYPSMGAALAQKRGSTEASFNIDYAIDAASVPHVSALDLLEGRVAEARIAGRSIVVGTSALELRDFFVVPRWGVLPGALLQALAAETLVQQRNLAPVGFWPQLALLLAVGLAFLLFGKRPNPLWAGLAAILSIAVIETGTFALQSQTGLLLDSAGADLFVATLALWVVLRELKTRGLQYLEASRERDAARLVLDRVITDNFDGVIVINGEAIIVAASHMAEEALGAGLVGRHAPEIIPAALSEAGNRVLAQRAPSVSGEYVFEDGRVIEYTITRSEVPTAPRRKKTGSVRPVACLTFRDITARRQAEARLSYLGTHDPLTGALSRTRLVEQIDETLADERIRAKGIGIVLVDLRRFRAINEALGHSAGDDVLRQVHSRLRSLGPDAVARVGGDSFVLLVPEGDGERLVGFCNAVLQNLSFPYQLAGGHQAIISASAGATISAVSGCEPESLLSHADMALSVAKRRPGGSVLLYAAEMGARQRSRRDMDGELRLAIERGQFSLAYQPQIALSDEAFVGAEALARWQHPTFGAVSPADFIPLAEETGLIVPLGRWIMERACAAATGWPAHLRVAVNVSPAQFELSDVVADLRLALAKSGLPPARLDIEITEGLFLSNRNDIIERLDAIRQLGIGIAIDDFGTGYSSLSYLGQLPVDKIKLDRSFVSPLGVDPQAAAIIQAVMTLASSLEKTVVAEGIETADQAWMLKMMGCDIGQGYRFGRPMPNAEFLAAVSAPKAKRAATG